MTSGTINSTRIELLNKDNYDTWSMQVEALLVKNDTWNYVCGETSRPNVTEGDSASVAAHRAWQQSDRKARADLILSISPAELPNVRHCQTSNEIWMKLKSIYASKGPARKATLLKQLTLQRMQEGEDVREHIGKFFDAVDKLQAMDVEINKDLLSIMLLYSLPDSFENFRCAIESRDELPSAESLKIKILEENDARKQKTKESESGALFAKQRRYQNQNWAQKNSRSAGRNKHQGILNSKIRCFKCNRSGHKSSECSWQAEEHSTEEDDEEEVDIYYISEGTEEEARKLEIESPASKWCLDSGCTSHICRDKGKFTNFSPDERTKLNLANNASTKIEGRGNVRFRTTDGTENKPIQLNNALFVQDLRSNLLSVAKITDQGNEVTFYKYGAVVNDKYGQTKMTAERTGNLYYVLEAEEEARTTTEAGDPRKLWHQRFGHLNDKALKQMSKEGKVKGMIPTPEGELPPCDICIQGKLASTPFKIRKERCEEILGIVHSDICGPMRTQSKGGAKYFATFIDDHSGWCLVYFLKKRDEILDAFKNFKNMMETETGQKIKALQTDNGTEYCSSRFNDFLKEHGIKRRLTVPHSPQQNGIAERRNRTLLDMARCQLIQSALPPSFWAEAISTANYIRNRCVSKSLANETPFERLKGWAPVVGHMRTFGTKVFILDKTPTRGKFEPRTKEGIFIGYPEQTKGYRIWLPEENKAVVSRDVQFAKETDIMQDSSNNEQTIITEVRPDKPPIETEIGPNVPNLAGTAKRGPGRPRIVRLGSRGRPRKEYQPARERSESDSSVSTQSERGRKRPPSTPRQNGKKRTWNTAKTGKEVTNEETDYEEDYEDEEVFGEPSEQAQGVTETENAVEYALIALELDVDEALKGPDSTAWKEAIKSEIESHVRYETWELVDRPRDKNVIGSKTVLRNKLKADGSLDKRKARIVARGFTQRPGTDYFETFAPVARLDSVRLLVALAVEHQLHLHQLDITTAYLNGTIEEELFMEIPKALDQSLSLIVELQKRNTESYKRAAEMLKTLREGNKVCKLKKAIYGLKQAGKQWHTKLDGILTERGLIATKYDPCVYQTESEQEKLIVLIYVDDILIASKNIYKIQDLKKNLSEKLEVKDIGRANFCLGIEINQQLAEVTLNQKKYTLELLAKYGMEKCNPVSTPAEVGAKLIIADQPEERLTNPRQYKELVGGLMYLAVATRPDIAHTVSALAQFNEKPEQQHWRAAKRLLRYLKGTCDHNLTFKKSGTPLTGYVDADWGNCTVNRRSYTGYAFILGSGAISWKAQKQKTVALSSTEAEYIALTEAAKEATYLKGILVTLGYQKLSTVVIKCDNQGAAQLALNNMYHPRTKHIDIRHHFIRDLIHGEEIQLEYISTQDMVADVMTKPLASPKHRQCIRHLGLKDTLRRN